jgi:hypothetical protein
LWRGEAPNGVEGCKAATVTLSCRSRETASFDEWLAESDLFIDGRERQSIR